MDPRELRALSVSADEHRPRSALVVCNERVERKVGALRIVPWRTLLEELWGGRIVR